MKSRCVQARRASGVLQQRYRIQLRITSGVAMPRCHTCGNDYAKAFEVTTAAGQRFTFDSIECAAYKLAPSCAHCGCLILGHGIEDGSSTYCCAHCARGSGNDEAVDNTTNR
jgi:hypothetical protein